MTEIAISTPVEWADHPGVYLVIDIKPSMAQVREWGRENAPMPWTMLSELTPITEDEAVERLCAEPGAAGARG